MKKIADHGVDEVRAARMEVSARYGHDIDRMLADHLREQAQYAGRLIVPESGRRKMHRPTFKKTAAMAG